MDGCLITHVDGVQAQNFILRKNHILSKINGLPFVDSVENVIHVYMLI